MYEPRFSNQSKKFIKKLDEQRKEQIQKAIDTLVKNPFSLPYKKLSGFEADYRVRIGEFRISYSVYKKELIILFVKIGKRENFYD